MAKRLGGHSAAADETKESHSLYHICLNVAKKTIPISVKLLCGLPRPLVEDLAVVLSPCEVLELEEALHSADFTAKAWEHHWNRFARPVMISVNKSSRVLDTARCMWVRQFVSTKLLPTFLSWDPERPEAEWPRIWEYMARDGNTQEQCPGLSPEEFLHHVKRLAGLVVEVVVSFRTLLNLSRFPQIIQALTTNLVELRVDWLSNCSPSAILKVLKELTMNGQLKILHLMTPNPLYSECVLLFFVVSGMFQCKHCAKQFSACRKLAAELSSQSKASCLCSCGTNSSDMDLKEESQWENGYCIQWKKFWINPEKADPKSHVYRSVFQNSKWKKADEFQRYITMCFCAHLPSGFLAILEDLGYAGLTDEDDDGTHQSATAAVDSCSVDAKIDSVLSTSTDLELYDIEDESETFNSEPVDLLDEVLGMGCASQCRWDWNKDRMPVDQRLLKALNYLHRDEQHHSPGIDQFIIRRMLGHRHNEPNAGANFLQGLSTCLPGWDSLYCLHLGGVFHLNPYFSDAENAKNAQDAILHHIQRGCLKYLTIKNEDETHNCLQQFFFSLFKALGQCNLNTQDAGESCEPMELLEVTGICMSNATPSDMTDTHSISGVNPDFAGGRFQATAPDFRGIHCFKLEDMDFMEPGSFRPVLELIQHNWKVRHLALNDCCLDEISILDVLTILNGEEFKYLEHLELNRTLRNPDERQWQAICQLLCRPHLSILSLDSCDLTSSHVNSDEFVEAVKKHGTQRSLTLSLSFNWIDGLWDFMLETVCPGSSLKILSFKYTCSNTETRKEKIAAD